MPQAVPQSQPEMPFLVAAYPPSQSVSFTSSIDKALKDLTLPNRVAALLVAHSDRVVQVERLGQERADFQERADPKWVRFPQRAGFPEAGRQDFEIAPLPEAGEKNCLRAPLPQIGG